jgi:UDP-N-acetylmuramate-alanine ligase
LLVPDKVFISNVYSANERKPVNFNLNKIIKLIGKGSNTVSCYLNSLDDIKEEMKKSKKNEIYIFLGAGDITDWPYKILDDLNEN